LIIFTNLLNQSDHYHIIITLLLLLLLLLYKFHVTRFNLMNNYNKP